MPRQTLLLVKREFKAPSGQLTSLTPHQKRINSYRLAEFVSVGGWAAGDPLTDLAAL